MTYRTHALKALTVIGALVLMAGCGSGSGGSSTGGSGTGGSAGAPVHGGNLVFAAVQDAQSMNATTVFDNNSIWILEQIFQPLYTVTNNGKGEMPWLATGYRSRLTRRPTPFTLRPGVKFSNGKPMTSADVKFSLDQNRKATKGWAYIDSAIKSVDDPSPETVVINLKYPWAPILADLSLFANGIVPDNYGGETEAAFYHPIGTGPFKWDYWHKGSALKLVRNPYYWQPGKPYLNSVTWTDVPSDNTRELQLKGGQAQIDQTPAWSTVASLKSTPSVRMDLFNSTQTNYLAFNELRKPFQDVHVRRAISLAINRNALVKAVLFGNGKPANSLFPPQVPYYDPSTLPAISTTWPRPRQQMAESSVPHGFTTTLLIPAGNSDYATIGTILQAELKPLGIKVNIQQLDPNTANADFQSLKYDMSLTLWTMDIPDPDELATFAVDPTSGAKSFFTAYDNPLGGQGHPPRREDAEHRQAPAALQHRPDDAAQDAFMAFLYYSPYPYATTSNVHGFYVTPLGNYHMENVWLSK
jgi:peptide/nickel transport system substrate-binding protein